MSRLEALVEVGKLVCVEQIVIKECQEKFPPLSELEVDEFFPEEAAD